MEISTFNIIIRQWGWLIFALFHIEHTTSIKLLPIETPLCTNLRTTSYILYINGLKRHWRYRMIESNILKPWVIVYMSDKPKSPIKANGCHIWNIAIKMAIMSPYWNSHFKSFVELARFSYKQNYINYPSVSPDIICQLGTALFLYHKRLMRKRQGKKTWKW